MLLKEIEKIEWWNKEIGGVHLISFSNSFQKKKKVRKKERRREEKIPKGDQVESIEKIEQLGGDQLGDLH